MNYKSNFLFYFSNKIHLFQYRSQKWPNTEVATHRYSMKSIKRTRKHTGNWYRPPWCQIPLNISTYPIFKGCHLERKHNVTPFSTFSGIEVPIPCFANIIYEIIQHFRFLKTCLSCYDVMTLWYHSWNHRQIYYNEVYHIYTSLYKAI